jgi:hypothetical protein
MKTAQVGRRLGMSPSTVYTYTIESLYADFFSDSAMRKDGRQQAEFTEDDVAVVWTVFRLRRKMSAEDVAMQLREGYRAKDFPVDASIDKAVDNIRALGVIPERDAALARVNELEEEVERLRAKDVANAQKIGQLEGELRVMKQMLPPEVKKLLGIE